MFSNVRAHLSKYCDLSWKELTLLKAWMKLSKSFNSFSPESFSSPSLRIAIATNEQRQPIAFCPVETILMVSAYAVSPTVSPTEAQLFGEAVDGEISLRAQQQGISKILIVVPENQTELPGEYKTMRVYERIVPPTFNMHGLGCSHPLQATQYQN